MGFILTHPHDKLREACKDVDFESPHLEDIFSDSGVIKRTLKRTNGLGLAANQLGYTSRIIYIKVNDEILEMINPIIIKNSGEQFEMEGCLSVPHYFSKIKRALHIEVQYQNQDSETKYITLSNLEAVEAQHEIDHLDGVLFIDHLSKTKKSIFNTKYKNILKNIKRGKMKGPN